MLSFHREFITVVSTANVIDSTQNCSLIITTKYFIILFCVIATIER